jgi:hypothetical protein
VLQLIDRSPSVEDRIFWAEQNEDYHDEPPAPRYTLEPWPVAPGFCRIVDSLYDAVVSHHHSVDNALITLAVLLAEAPADPDPANEARPSIVRNDAP